MILRKGTLCALMFFFICLTLSGKRTFSSGQSSYSLSSNEEFAKSFSSSALMIYLCTKIS